MFQMRKSVELAVKNEILNHDTGWCFTPMDFVEVGSSESVRQALSSLCKQNIIRRLAQGIYELPREHDILGTIPPAPHEIATAIARKNGVQIQPTGAHAANLVGLCEQVPGRVVYLTEGPSRKVKIGNIEIEFRKTTNKVMSSSGTREGLVIQAYKNLGKDHIDQIIRARTQKFLEPSDPKEIQKNMKFAPLWIRTIIFNIMGITK
jgi:hypothetical protein